jgi:hypothetical protein
MYEAGRIYSSLGTGTNLVQGWYYLRSLVPTRLVLVEKKKKKKKKGCFLLPQKKYQPGRLLSNT